MTVNFRPAVRENPQFWRHTIFAPNGCWPWIGARFAKGYGRVRISRTKTRMAHRIAFELANGCQIPDGMMVCHRCDNPPCCNPQHLFLGTARDNVRDCMHKNRRADLKGERHPSVKLTVADVLTIRARRVAGERLQDIAAAFGVTIQNVHCICARKTWGHV